jgi:hypothetical protein
MWAMTLQELVGVMESIGIGGMNLDPTMFRNPSDTGSAFPAQIRVRHRWRYRIPLRGERLFEIIGPNLGYQDQPIGSFKVPRRDVDHVLTMDQVHPSPGRQSTGFFPPGFRHQFWFVCHSLGKVDKRHALRPQTLYLFF